MSLRTDVSKVRNYKALYEGNTFKDKPWGVILWSMAICMDEITEENYKAFYNRIVMLDMLYGVKKNAIKLRDVKRMVGLEVNVATQTSAQFLRRFNKFI